MTTQTHAEKMTETLDRYRAELESGRVFTLHAQSQLSRYRRDGAGFPILTRCQWSTCIEQLGKMANVSDALAQIARAAIVGINLYGTEREEAAKVWAGAAKAVREGYVDVVRGASPEPGRLSDRERPFTLAEVATAAHWLYAATDPMDTSSIGGPGWALKAITEEVGIRPHELPR